MRYGNHNREKPGAGTCFACMLIGLFMGYVFLQQPAQHAPVPREEAVFLSGPLEECRVRYQKGHIHGISLDITGQKRQFVSRICASDALAEALRELPEGTVVELLIHPLSHDVMEIRVGKEILLNFERAQERASRDADGFGMLGIFLVIMGVWSGIRYVIEEIRFYRK